MDELYEKLVAAGVTIEHHESDLYVPVNETTVALLAEARKTTRIHGTTFQGSDGKLWYELPFMYKPFWDDVERKGREAEARKANDAARWERITELREHRAGYPRSKSADHAETWEQQYPDAAAELAQLEKVALGR